MTYETRATVELKDLIAVEYECRECHAKSVRPIGGALRDAPNSVPQQCGNCGANWMNGGDGQRHVSQLLNLIALLADQARTKFTLRFEVTGLPPQLQGPRA